jgi:hypothetical protein
MHIQKVGFFRRKEKINYARSWEGEHFDAESGKLFTRPANRWRFSNSRQTQGEYNFAGQYQQAPAPLGAGLVKQSW